MSLIELDKESWFDNSYTSSNALIRLYSNYKKYKPQTNQDWVNIIQNSIQEGLVLNLNKILKSTKANNEQIASVIVEFKNHRQKDDIYLNIAEEKRSMLRRLNSHKINKISPDKFTKSF